MFTSIPSVAVRGLDGVKIDVEVDVHGGLPKFFIVGLPDAAIQESRERVRAAIKNSGFEFPKTRITVNLAPADVRKSGPCYDLPIAIGLIFQSLAADRTFFEKSLFLGELSLDGLLRPVTSVLPSALFAKSADMKRIILPRDNAAEAALVPDIDVIAADNLTGVVQMIQGTRELEVVPQTNPESLVDQSSHTLVDFAAVVGQEHAKRALLIAAAGGHNVLMQGPPGSGKTMLAKAFASILPPMVFEEIVDVSKIYSVAGLLSKEQPLIVDRPFRRIHHTASAVSIIGGGRESQPGEISLAHRGVLFLDELLEFPSHVLETLRQPLEDGEITINRVQSSFTYPSRFMLIGALNPCPCGYLGDTSRECTCAPFKIDRYRSRLSGPLLDRMDMFLNVPRVEIEDIKKRKTEGISSDQMRGQVIGVRAIQSARFANSDTVCNAHMDNKLIQIFCQLDNKTEEFLHQATVKLDLSTRSYFRILRLSRTIADLEGRERISFEDVAEALSYREIS